MNRPPAGARTALSASRLSWERADKAVRAPKDGSWKEMGGVEVEEGGEPAVQNYRSKQRERRIETLAAITHDQRSPSW